MKLLGILKNVAQNRTNLVAWSCRLINAGAQVMLMPYIITNYGMDSYATLLFISSVMSWLMLLDFGLTLNMQNTISRSVSRGVRYEKLIRNTNFLVYVLAILILFSIGMSAEVIINFFHKEKLSTPYIYWAVILYGFIVSTSNVVYRLMYAKHKGHIVNLIPTIGMLVSGVMIFIGVGQSLVALINIWYAPTCGIIFYFAVKIFLQYIGRLDWRYMKVLLRRSLPYGLIAIGGASVQQVDIFILSSFVSDVDLVSYSVVAKVMTFFSFMANVIIANNWASCAEASSARNWVKVNLIFRNVIYGGFGIILIGTFFCLLFSSFISTILTNGKIGNVSLLYWFAFLFMSLIRFWSDSFMMLIQGAGKNNIFIYYLPIQAILSIFFQIVITESYGAIGVIIGQALAFILTSVWILPIYYKKLSRG